MKSERTVQVPMTATKDISRRYVLPEDAPLLRNLAALWALDATLARRIEELHPAEPYPVQPAKMAGAPTVSVRAPGGRSVSLHSRYDPVQEAKQLVDTLEIDGKVVFYL